MPEFAGPHAALVGCDQVPVAVAAPDAVTVICPDNVAVQLPPLAVMAPKPDTVPGMTSLPTVTLTTPLVTVKVSGSGALPFPDVVPL